MKKLYFEGAGMFGCRDTAEELRGNCRLRTMFHDDKGRAVYLEILSGMNKTAGRLYVDSCHYIGKDDYKMLRLPVERDGKRREYTPEGILALLDEIGAHFDAVEVLPRLAGYQVFADEYHSGDTEAEYMRGDTFAPDWAEIARREAVYNDLCDAERAPGSSGLVLACGPCRIARTCAGIICRAPESMARSSRRSIWQASNKPNGAALR